MKKNDNGIKTDMYNIFKKFQDGNNFTNIGKVLGKGTFGEVRDITYKNKTMAGKIIKQGKNEIEGEYEAYDLRGQNIIKISKILKDDYDNSTYYLIIMEKAILRDLGKLSDYYHNHNLLKLIFNPFNEAAGDNLLRFYSKQIVNALEILNRGRYVHFDLKPENLLISISLIVKLSDFSLLKKINDEDMIKIPGGTNGYLTPEYYNKGEKISGSKARKQDYFALGATLFFLKFGRQMLKYKKSEDNTSIALSIIEKLQYEKSFIRSSNFADQDFIDFICSLISISPDDRPDFESIYRNKWLNKNSDELHKIFWGFEYDEEKLIMELQKNDYLIEKEKQINKTPCRFKFKKKRT